MPVNSDQTLVAILNHKGVFFRLIDRVHLNSKNPSMEFTISDYEALMVETARNFDTSLRRRFYETLSLENLERNGLLNYLDRRTGRFRLQDFILEMLRHLDSKRLRELSSAELNQLMKQLEECYRQVSDPTVLWIPGDSTFEELVESVFQNLQHVASRLKSNVRALRGQAERLASIVDEQDFTDLERTDQVRVALNEILRIHERHVTPTLQFLDERLDIRRARTELFGDSAPMALVKQIIGRFIERKLSDHVTRLQRIQFHILALGREVGGIAKTLDTYVKYAEAERRRYNRTEQLYNELRDAVQQRQTGQLRDFMLRSSHSVFKPARPLGTLKNFSRAQSANINWPQIKGTRAFDEVLRTRVAMASVRPKPLISNGSEPVTAEEIEERRMMERILQAMRSYDYSKPCKDVYLSVHHHLSEHMEGYSLNQLMDALPFLNGKGTIEPSASVKFLVLEYQDMRLRYRQRVYRRDTCA